MNIELFNTITFLLIDNLTFIYGGYRMNLSVYIKSNM